jgi:UDP-glucose 4-epimerase
MGFEADCLLTIFVYRLRGINNEFMKVLVTGTAGHLGQALAYTLKNKGYEVVGVDIKPSAYTTHPGSVADREHVKNCMQGVQLVFHAATLHKPHVATHTMQQFIDTNISGTLNLLEESVAAGVKSFVFTSTTSIFGDALVPPPGEPAAWITEEVTPVPKNIYGVTKAAAENLCRLMHRKHGLPCIVLRTSRFFPEDDDDKDKRNAFAGDNLKANEYLFRRVDIEDAVEAHLLAAEKAAEIGFGTYIISATSPFGKADLAALREDAPSVVKKYVPEYADTYQQLQWTMLTSMDRVYINQKALHELGWKPAYDFAYIIKRLGEGHGLQSPLAKIVGVKGYHQEEFDEGPYPVDQHL